MHHQHRRLKASVFPPKALTKHTAIRFTTINWLISLCIPWLHAFCAAKQSCACIYHGDYRLSRAQLPSRPHWGKG